MSETRSLATPDGAASSPLTERDAVRRFRRIISAGAFGTIVEYFDFSVYAFLATTIADVFFAKGDPTAALLYTLGVFGASFVLRPLGGILIGHLGDRYGRRPALTISVAGMAFASTAIGLLPSYASIGVAAPVLLFVLRCVQGLSAGGELGSAASYVAEVAPDSQRGRMTSTMNLGTMIGTMLGSACVAVLHITLSHEALLAWGWRLPFLISLPLGVITLMLRSRMEESRQFERLEQSGAVSKVPAFDALRSSPRGVLIVCGLSLVSFMSYYLTFTYMSTYFQRQGVMSSTAAAWSTTVTLVLAMLVIPFWGRMSDRVGRRPLLIAVCLADLLLAYPAFLVMSYSTAFAVVAQILLGQLEALYMSVILSTYCEQFPARVRASGFNLGYNLASILAGGTAPYLATALIAETGNAKAPAWMLIVAAAVSLCAALWLKETANRPLPVM
ncbi:MFS transporter [Burkholderia sp. 22PA0099]|uniref:MFS transporter n=1 Tax=Burkholderia sp. 22PA0099 TaxID=3237372 RepID=UPI0039C37A4F